MGCQSRTVHSSSWRDKIYPIRFDVHTPPFLVAFSCRMWLCGNLQSKAHLPRQSRAGWSRSGCSSVRNIGTSSFSKQHRFCEISCPDTKTWDLCGLIEQTAENSSHQNRICLLWRLRREFLVCIYEFDSPQNGFTLLHKEILLNVYDDHPFENPEAGWSVWHLPNNDTII